MEGRKDNACRDAESYLLLLAINGDTEAAEAAKTGWMETFGEERREIVEVVADGRAQGAPAAEIMNTLSSQGQAELARILVMALPPEQEKQRLRSDCLRTIEARALARQLDAAREELKIPGLTEEAKTEKKQELNLLLKKLSAVRNHADTKNNR
jgi:hypothetical protein